MDANDPIVFKNRREWRRWLTQNHGKREVVWLVHFKKGSLKKGIRLGEAVEEAICFGWIDGQLQSVDKDCYALRYTPRRKGSVWSQINKDTANRMISNGKMTRAGLKSIEDAKRCGTWASAYSSKKNPTVPEDLQTALAKDGSAMKKFNKLSNSNKFQYVFWVDGAKKAETRKARIAKVVKILH